MVMALGSGLNWSLEKLAHLQQVALADLIYIALTIKQTRLED